MLDSKLRILDLIVVCLCKCKTDAILNSKFKIQNSKFQ